MKRAIMLSVRYSIPFFQIKGIMLGVVGFSIYLSLCMHLQRVKKINDCKGRTFVRTLHAIPLLIKYDVYVYLILFTDVLLI